MVEGAKNTRNSPCHEPENRGRVVTQIETLFLTTDAGVAEAGHSEAEQRPDGDAGGFGDGGVRLFTGPYDSPSSRRS